MCAMRNKKKILIVDDEPDICTSVCGFLKEAGYETFQASRGEEGFGILLKEKPDVLILDIALPDVDGTVLYERIRKTPEVGKTKVIFLTALATGAPEQFAGIDHPEYTIMSKPMKIEALQSEIERVLS